MTVRRPTPAQQRLAAGLARLRELRAAGVRVFQSRDFDRRAREALERGGFLRRVIRGWYIAVRPDEDAGDTTAWNASLRDFVGRYCTHRFGSQWCLSPELSVLVHAGSTLLPKQIVVMATRGTRNTVELLAGHSIFDSTPVTTTDERDVVQMGPLRVLRLPVALTRVSDVFFQTYSADAYVALRQCDDVAGVLRILTEKGHSHVAGRLAGAFRAAHQPRIADDIIATMTAAGFHVTESNPFHVALPRLGAPRALSPYVDRLRILWQRMREDVVAHCPAPPTRPVNPATYLEAVGDAYRTDAYHSLSIEGYDVTDALIARVAAGEWNPDGLTDDAESRNAMAARGYYMAHRAVRGSLRDILAGANPGAVVERDHGGWYRDLFAPSVSAGILTPAHLAGYRDVQVFIRNARYVPPSADAVPAMMSAFFELLQAEESSAVRAVLGHLLFVFIHPYVDGNGRMARFLMNAMLAAGGYPWTVIPVTRRTEYLDALDAATAGADIVPFTRFVASCVGVTPPTAMNGPDAKREGL